MDSTAAALQVPDSAVRRWRELVEQRATLGARRCSCGCRCALGQPRLAGGRVAVAGGSHDRDRRRPA
jgi:hypothetical protein